MTWYPLSKATCNYLIPSLGTALLGGSLALAFIPTKPYYKLKPSPTVTQEEQEMKRWSENLQNPSHKDYNPFIVS